MEIDLMMDPNELDDLNVKVTPHPVSCAETPLHVHVLERHMSNKPLFDKNVVSMIAMYATNAVKVTSLTGEYVATHPYQVAISYSQLKATSLDDEKRTEDTMCHDCQRLYDYWIDAYTIEQIHLGGARRYSRCMDCSGTFCKDCWYHHMC